MDFQSGNFNGYSKQRIGAHVHNDEELAKEINRSVQRNVPAEAICQLAIAAQCSVLLDRNANLVFFDPLIEANAIDSLDYDVMAAMPKIIVGEKINAVELTVKNEYTEKEKVWSAVDSSSDEIPQVSEHANSVASDGAATAAWLLEMLKRRISYSVTERGNPAREIGDSVIIRRIQRSEAVVWAEQSFLRRRTFDTEVNANGYFIYNQESPVPLILNLNRIEGWTQALRLSKHTITP